MAEAGRRKRQQKDNGTTVDSAKILLGIGAIIVLIGIGAVAFWVAGLPVPWQTGQRSGVAVTRQPAAPVQPAIQEVQLQVQPARSQAQPIQSQGQQAQSQVQEVQPEDQQVQPAQIQIQPVPPLQPVPEAQPQEAAAEEASLRQAQDDAADVAPDITLKTLGGEFQLSQKRGNVVILYFTFVG